MALFSLVLVGMIFLGGVAPFGIRKPDYDQPEYGNKEIEENIESIFVEAGIDSTQPETSGTLHGLNNNNNNNNKGDSGYEDAIIIPEIGNGGLDVGGKSLNQHKIRVDKASFNEKIPPTQNNEGGRFQLGSINKDRGVDIVF